MSQIVASQLSHIVQVLEEEDGAVLGEEYEVVNVHAKVGMQLYERKRLFEISPCRGIATPKITIKASFGGIVKKVLARKGEKIVIGSQLLEIAACTHPTILGNICCDCGNALDDEDTGSGETDSKKSVSMLHSIPELRVSKEEAERLGTEDINSLLKQKKLVLLLDLDQTLIHTTNDNIPPKLKDVYHFQLARNGPWYHIRLRPYTKSFLESVSKHYELHICTFGVREYAHFIAHFLDPDHRLFGQRILSRNECLDPMSKKANLTSLFPCGDNLVCIIDDRSDVWNFAPNVVQVLPYHFFQHTGDINAPPGLQKKEDDEMKGFDFTKLSLEKVKKKNAELDKCKSADKEGSLQSFADSEICLSESEGDSDSRSPAASDGDEPKLEELSTENASLITETETSSFCPVLSDDQDSLVKGKDSGCECEEKDDESSSGRGSKNIIKEIVLTSETCAQTEDSEISEDTKSNSVDDRKEETKPLLISDKDDDDEVIDVADPDDYLLYLEDILVKIHHVFYIDYEANKAKGSSSLPDLKWIIPQIRSKVLLGVNIVFSSIVPQHVKLEDSKAYHIARQLGANVSPKLVLRPKQGEPTESDKLYTTHLVAANLQTEKVHQARRHKYIKTVTPNWLWCCVERWEKVDERLFLLTPETVKDVRRMPPMHCCIATEVDSKNISKGSTYERNEDPVDTSSASEWKSSRKRTASGDFLEDINPLAFLTNEETKSMEEEVDDVLSGDDDDKDDNNKEAVEAESTSESSDGGGGSDSHSGHEHSSHKRTLTDDESDEYEEGDEILKRKRPRSVHDEEEESEDELPSVRFRQGGSLPSDDSDEDECSDDDLNEFGNILEKKLLE